MQTSLPRPALALATGCALLHFLIPSAAMAQLPSVDPMGSPQPGLRIYSLDVGQGDATLVIGPGGKTLLLDGGPDGIGTSVILPRLKQLGVRRLDYVVASHYHPDHVGGLDEVLKGIPVGAVYDRGNNRASSTSYFKAYVSAAGKLRKTVPVGFRFDLGLSVKAQVLCVDGYVLGRTGQLPLKSTYQEENARSIAMRIDYKDFSLFLGGDLTGGGNRTYDVERYVAPLCGNVDVYKASHHGSSTSSSTTMLGRLDPELTLLSNGARNPYGHPSTTVLNRFNTRSNSRSMLCTSRGAGWSGFTKFGEIAIVSDGFRYRVTEPRGRFFDYYTDEYSGRSPRPGDLVISEIQRRPSISKGEYIELYNRSGEALELSGLSIRGNGGYFTIDAPYRLLPGSYFVLYSHGDDGTNGGIPVGHCWPYRALSLGDTSDRIRVLLGSVSITELSYGAGFAGGSGVAAELQDLLGKGLASAYAAATKRYGSGGLGSPGARNARDTTRYGIRCGVEVLPASGPFGPGIHLLSLSEGRGAAFHVFALSNSTSPGIRVGSVVIPLNPGPLFSLSVGLPGFVGRVPSSGRRGLALSLPIVPGLRGSGVYAAQFLIDPFGATPVPAASRSSFFRYP